jgi:hypothetical protein
VVQPNARGPLDVVAAGAATPKELGVDLINDGGRRDLELEHELVGEQRRSQHNQQTIEVSDDPGR